MQQHSPPANRKKTRQLLGIGDAAKYLGVSIDTIRRWEKKGRIESFRSPGGHRYFQKAELDTLFDKKYTRDDITIRKNSEPNKDEHINHSANEDIKKTEQPEETRQRVRVHVVEEHPNTHHTKQEETDSPTPSDSLTPDLDFPDWIVELKEKAQNLSIPKREIIKITTERVYITGTSYDDYNENKPTPKSTTEETISILEMPPTQNRDNPPRPHPDHSAHHVPASSASSHDNQRGNISTEKREKKKLLTQNRLILIGLIVFLALDIILITIWYATTRIISPLP
jgi:excisionase family DNA binding protein